MELCLFYTLGLLLEIGRFLPPAVLRRGQQT
jgi:hypothetical protein